MKRRLDTEGTEVTEEENTEAQGAIKRPRLGAPTIRCRHWAKGYCRLEVQCNFAHDGNAGMVPRQDLCRHWARGQCNLATECKFSHHGEAGTGGARFVPPAAPMNAFSYALPPSQSPYFAQPQQAFRLPQQYQPYGPPGIQSISPYPQAYPYAAPPGYPETPQPFSLVGASARPGKPCRHFQRGFCERGEACQFSHVKDSNSSVPPSPTAAAGRVGTVPCRHFSRGHCNMGAQCRFQHNAGGQSDGAASAAQQSQPEFTQTEGNAVYVQGQPQYTQQVEGQAAYPTATYM